jgi:hypothetical protein
VTCYVLLAPAAAPLLCLLLKLAVLLLLPVRV